MRSKQQRKARHDDLFRAHLDQIINMKHALVALADRIDWAWLDAELAEYFSQQARPAEPARFMMGMFLLKHTYGLSDEQVWDRWVHDPYFQYFTGEEFFCHALSHERSGMSHWRTRIGERLDILLAGSLRIADDTGALRTRNLARVTVDTTVQPKNVTFPTDTKLLETAIRRLGALAKAHGVPLRQSLWAARHAGREIERFHFENAFVGRDLPNRVNRSGRKCGVHGHLGRKYLKDCRGGWIIAAMDAVGYNFRLILGALRHCLGNIIAAI